MRWQANHYWLPCIFVSVVMHLAVSGKVLRPICLCRRWEKHHSMHSSFVALPLNRLSQEWRCWQRSTMEPSLLSEKDPCWAPHFTRRFPETHVFISTFSA